MIPLSTNLRLATGSCWPLLAVAILGCDPASVLFPGDPRPPSEGDGDPLTPPAAPSEVAPPRDGLPGLPGASPQADDRAARSPWGEELPTLPPGAGVDPLGCAAITTQSAWCVSLRDDAGPGATVVFLGLDDGASCEPLGAPVGSTPTAVTSLALHDNHLFWCDSATVVQRVDMNTGLATATAAPALSCAGLTSLAGGIALLPQGLGRELSWYARPEDLAAGGRGSPLPMRPWASRIAADLNTVYASWHETEVVQRWEHDGTPLEPLSLEWFGWVHGLDAANADRLVVLDDERDLRIFDSVTGALLQVLPQDGTLTGLACFPDPA